MAREPGTLLINFPAGTRDGKRERELLILARDAGKGSGTAFLISAEPVGIGKFVGHALDVCRTADGRPT